jgi:hypothetical protein
LPLLALADIVGLVMRKRPLRSAFLATASTLALAGCDSPPHDNPPPVVPAPSASAPADTASATGPAPSATVAATPTPPPEIHFNPPPPKNQTSHALNPDEHGSMVFTDGHGRCYVNGEKQASTVPCPALMKDPVWAKCADGHINMADDGSWCRCVKGDVYVPGDLTCPKGAVPRSD